MVGWKFAEAVAFAIEIRGDVLMLAGTWETIGLLGAKVAPADFPKPTVELLDKMGPLAIVLLFCGNFIGLETTSFYPKGIKSVVKSVDLKGITHNEAFFNIGAIASICSPTQSFASQALGNREHAMGCRRK